MKTLTRGVSVLSPSVHCPRYIPDSAAAGYTPTRAGSCLAFRRLAKRPIASQLPCSHTGLMSKPQAYAGTPELAGPATESPGGSYAFGVTPTLRRAPLPLPTPEDRAAERAALARRWAQRCTRCEAIPDTRQTGAQQ